MTLAFYQSGFSLGPGAGKSSWALRNTRGSGDAKTPVSAFMSFCQSDCYSITHVHKLQIEVYKKYFFVKSFFFLFCFSEILH